MTHRLARATVSWVSPQPRPKSVAASSLFVASSWQVGRALISRESEREGLQVGRSVSFLLLLSSSPSSSLACHLLHDSLTNSLS